MTGVPEWMGRAACQGMGPGMFHPSNTKDGEPAGGRVTPEYREAVAKAVLVCSHCPVRDQCRDWAYDHNETAGIWGGLTEGQRRNTRKPGPQASIAGAA